MSIGSVRKDQDLSKNLSQSCLGQHIWLDYLFYGEMKRENKLYSTKFVRKKVITMIWENEEN